MAWAYLEKRDSNAEAAYKYLLLAKQYLQSTDKYDVQLKFYIDEAYILYELEQYDAALNSIDQAEAILVTHQGASLLKKQNYVSIINLKANVYYKQGQFEQAYNIKSAVVTAITAIYDKKRKQLNHTSQIKT
jgi:tetratricopeptide (TPR) repeat protein